MKSLTKRNLTLIVLSVVVALCSLTFAATVKPVRAEEIAKPETLQFQVMEAASIRIGKSADNDADSTSGLRFRVQMDYATASYVKGNEGVKLGFIITPKALFDKRAAAEDSSYGIDDYIKSISKYVGNDREGIIVNEETIYIADASDNITKWESTADDAQAIEGASYYANGAVQGIFKDNINLGFTVIAYILDGEEYTYSVPSADFERSYTQTATKAYFSGKNDLEVIQKAQHLSNFGKEETNPLAITDGQELYKISEDVSNEKTYNGFYFELRENVEVDYDFEQIGATFGGEFINNTNDKVVSIVNNKDLQDAFADASVNVDCVNNTKLFNATEKAIDLLTLSGNASAVEFVEKENLPLTTYDGASDIGNQTNKPANGTIKKRISNANEISIRLNYSKEELLAMVQPIGMDGETPIYSDTYGKYNAVRFSYLATQINETSFMVDPNAENDNGVFDIIKANSRYGGEVLSENWVSQIVEIEDFVNAIYTKNSGVELLFVTRFGCWTDEIFDFYICDIELIKDTTTIYSPEIYSNKSSVLTSSYSKTSTSEDGLVTYYKSSWTSSSASNHLLEYKSVEKIPKVTSSDKEITGSYNGIVGMPVKKTATQTGVYAHLRWNADELRAIYNEHKAKGVELKVSITYMVFTNNSTWGTYGIQGTGLLTGSKGKVREWRTMTFDFETEFMPYVGKVSNYYNNGTTRVVSNPELIKDDLLFLHDNYGSSAVLYLAEIKFVESAAQ